MNRQIVITNRVALLGALLLSSLVLIVTTAPLAQAAPDAIRTVTSVADSGPGSLRQTISDAASGDTIVFDGALFASAQTIQLASGLTINKSLTIDGSANGVYTPTIAGPGPGSTYFRVISITLSTANVTLNNLIIAGGNLTGTTALQAGGAGIYSTGRLTVTHSLITHNVSSSPNFGYGGGLYLASGGVTLLTDSQVISNTGSIFGGGIYSAGTFTLTRSVVADNFNAGSSNRYGGGIYQASGTIAITSSTISGNTNLVDVTFSGSGGGLYSNSVVTRIDIADSAFYSNTTRNDGGGLSLTTTTYPATLSNLTIYNNRSTGGSAGGLYTYRLTMTDSTVYSNTATGAAGLYANTALTLTNVKILSNTATGSMTSGGLGAGTNAVILITGGLFQNNRAAGALGQGGAIRTDTNARVTITDTQFISNTSAGNGLTYGGGAIYALNALTLTNGLFQGNSASSGSGGAIHSTSTTAQLNIFNTQFFSNTAASNGGGLYLLGPATLSGDTLQGNRCTGTGCFIGNGLYTSGTLTVTASTPYTYSDNLNLRGNLYTSGNWMLTEAAVTFSGNTPQIIGGADPTAFYQLVISNTTGVTLGQHQSVSSILTLTTDLTTTASYVLTLGDSAAVTGAGEVVGTVRRISPAAASPRQLNSQYTTFNFASAPAQLDVNLTRASHPNANALGGGAYMLPRYYTLNPTGSVDATVCLSYRDAELGAITETALRLCRWTGTGWSCPTRGAGSSTATNTVCAENVTEFSDWTLGAVGPTAVALRDLTATTTASYSLVGVLGAALAALGALALGRRVKARA